MPQVITTARWAAAQRARESQRPDRLFSDPFASQLAGAEGALALELSEKANTRHADTAAYIAIRVKFLDDFVMTLASEGIRQVVVPAAGLDVRAFRLEWPAGTTLYEIDHPELFETKNQILSHESAQPKCPRITIGIDLEKDWAVPLKESGFSPTEPSVWLVEGLLYYLTEQAVHQFLDQVSKLASSGSGLGVDIVSNSTITSPWMQEALKQMEKSGFVWKFGTDNPEELLKLYGWQTEVRQLGETGANFGRWQAPIVPRAQKEVPRTFLVTARKT